MSFKEAYNLAMADTRFAAICGRIERKAARGEQTVCLTFSVLNQVYSYGFDGCDWHRVKHTPKRSRELLDRGEVLIIA